MTTKDYQRKKPLMIFLSYFGNHKKLFAIDVTCAVLIAAIDLAFPLVTRSALYDMLPGQMYRTFFTVMIAVVASYVLRSFLQFIVAYYGHTFGIRVEADIRKDLFRHMQPEIHKKTPSLCFQIILSFLSCFFKFDLQKLC